MKNNKSNAGLWVMALLTVFILGYVIYVQLTPVDSSSTSDVPTDSQEAENSDNVNNVPVPPEGISDLEKEALQPPSDDASMEIVNEYKDVLGQVSSRTDRVRIDSNCTMTPLVARVTTGEIVTITNRANVEINLSLHTESYSIPTDESVTWSTESGVSEGYFSLACVKPQQEGVIQSGLIWLTEE